jgi:antirestriction protein ArdC
MPHAAPAHKSFADRASLYQEISDKINRAIIRAASAASKAADYLLAFCGQDDQTRVEGPAVAAIQRPTPRLSMAVEVQP